MKRFAVIGLGHFGGYAARTLYEAGRDVIAIDLDNEVVQSMADYATQAIVADATDRNNLEAIGVGEVDAAVVSLGERMDIITLAALHLKEMGIPFIAVKALSEDHGKILTALGVNEIIFPEKDMAVRLANRLARTDVVDFLPLLPGYSIIEVKAPDEFVGKSLRDLAMRNTLNVQLIAILRGQGKNRIVNIVPRGDDVIEAEDILILVGENRHLDRIREIVKTPPARA